MEVCPHCMRQTQSSVCTHCGLNVAHVAPPGQLPVGFKLKSTDTVYMVGAAKGQGGFGITYAAMNLKTGQRVAIKEYFPTMCATRDRTLRVAPIGGQQNNYYSGMKSFMEESLMLQAVKALYSVVTVHEVFQFNGTAYLVMEYVDGTALHVILQQRRMTAQELLPKLPKLIADLDIMHCAGVIHRDIAPDNLMLMPDGTLKLLDFGSARSVQNGKSMTVLLKKGFSPVEQYQSRGQGPHTDVYALAATIYYCLTGQVPPEAISRLEKENDPILRPNQLGAGLTMAQENALLRGMKVQPKERPQTMEEFGRLLCGKLPSSAPWRGPVQTLTDPNQHGSLTGDDLMLGGAQQGNSQYSYDAGSGQDTILGLPKAAFFGILAGAAVLMLLMFIAIIVLLANM